MKRPPSIRRRLFVMVGGFALLVVLGAAGIVTLSVFLSRSDAARIEAYASEREAANRVMRGILRQLGAGTAADPVAAFEAAGDDVREAMRSYALEDLSRQEQLKLDSLRTTHIAMEAEAERAYNLFLGGDLAAGLSSWARETVLGYAFIDNLESFLMMRQEGVEDFHARQNAIVGLLFILSGILGVVVWAGGGAVAWTVNRRVTRPLGRLSEASSRLGQGDLGARVPLEDDSEFRDLSMSFNGMAEQLEGMTSDLKEKNAQLTDALAQVNAAQADLIQSEKLGAMGRMTAGLAHELNNPLTSVLGYSQLLDEALASEHQEPSAREIRRDFLAPILRDALRARNLIKEFLQLARKSPGNLTCVSMRDTLNRVSNQMQGTAHEAGVKLRIGNVPDVSVKADTVMLDGIFMNIVGNAIDALGEGGRAGVVSIEAAVAEDRVVVAIEDNGPGLAQPERIFEPFYTSKPVGKGTGLGLALAHQFVVQFGGSIQARNAEDGGARFVVALPIAKQPRDSNEDGEPSPAISATDMNIREAADRDDPLPHDGGPRILVVEDEELLRDLQKRLLGRLDAQVFLAGSASEAREVLNREPVDAVICDIKMPGESGYEFYRSIARERPDITDRFLFVTGDVGCEDVATLTEERPDMLIQKPFDVADYLSRVRNLIESAPV